jgi:hypothetical protein
MIRHGQSQRVAADRACVHACVRACVRACVKLCGAILYHANFNDGLPFGFVALLRDPSRAAHNISLGKTVSLFRK